MHTNCQRNIINFILLISHKFLAITKICLITYFPPNIKSLIDITIDTQLMV